MENLNLTIVNDNGKLYIDSREIAKMVDKKHGHLCRDIMGYIEAIGQNPNLDSDDFFFPGEYISGTGKKYRRFLVTKKGCDMIANKITGKKGILFTAAYVDKFYEMKNQLTIKDSYMIADPIERAKRWIEEETVRIEQAKQIEVMAPKAEFYDTVTASETTISMGDVAKVLDMGVGRNKLFRILRDKGVLDSNNKPYQRYVDAGYFKLKESTFKAGFSDIVATTTYVKQKGVDFIRKLLRTPQLA